MVAEGLPAHVSALLGCFKVLSQQFKFIVTNLELSKVETNSELGVGNVSRAKLIKVSEELSNADAPHGALFADASTHIIDILWHVANDFGLADTWARLGVVVEGVVVLLANTVKLRGSINVFTEVNVVNLINIALVHVPSAQFLEDVFASADSQQVEHTQELELGNVAVASLVEVLEGGFEVNAALHNSAAVLIEHGLHGIRVLVHTGLEVLAASEQGIVLCNGWHAGVRGLVDAAGGEGLVDRLREGNIVEELLGVISLVLVSQCVVLLLSEVEVKLGQNGVELLLSDMTLAQLVEINEELLNSNALHHNHGAETVLNISWVVVDDDSWLLPPVVDHIEIGSGRSEEW